MSSKRHRSDDDSDRESKRSHARRRHRRHRRRRRHLYVVLDDWSKGYSIYKVDVDGFDGDPDADLDDEAVRLPDPPLFRLETADRGRFAHFAAVGSRIFAMHYSEETNARAPLLVFDTATSSPSAPPYSFDAVANEWTRHGGWMLPFEGQAYYDDELDAWVGLSSGHSSIHRRGRVCSCDVVDPKPAWKLAAWNPAGFAHMGTWAAWRWRNEVRQRLPEEKCLLYATTFRLRYNRNGALEATDRRAPSFTRARNRATLNGAPSGSDRPN
uniref:Uncharacterized protein n=1 Tax=Leersia perrieri TaxID=77586 RepID=A0A0D9VR39_9ORYZ